MRSVDNSLAVPNSSKGDRERRVGGGRDTILAVDPTLEKDLKALLEDGTHTDPSPHLLWTNKSTYELAENLQEQGHSINARTVSHLLNQFGYSLQNSIKVPQGKQSTDRDEQFKLINERASKAIVRGQPFISVDFKIKQWVGPNKNGGKTHVKEDQPSDVEVHDYCTQDELANPYGCNDPQAKQGWVNIGADKDTSDFVIGFIRNWWYGLGQKRYPLTRELTIVADRGFTNGKWVGSWKYELSRFAREIGHDILVMHYPPGTRKWNKIEHRMSSCISMNGRAITHVRYEITVNLISNITTETGMKINADIDTNQYPLGKKMTDKDISSLPLIGDEFFPEMNYTLLSDTPNRSEK